MVALSTIVIFFFVLVIIYPAAVSLLVLAGWIKKRRAVRSHPHSKNAVQIDEDTDRLKNRVFMIAIIISFFMIAPFLALLLVY